MYLKSLVLKGFKSFADRSVLALEPGITAIVGPNGSGKSNISDAVLWVLGERSARNLRGQAMEDIIFSGSAARKAVSIAEVDLVLDNSDHTLPVDYDEVVLTRRMYRSGESEYLVNGVVSRRLDVLDILHDTGLGIGTHSIISQGSLDSILQSKPEDRRALIEEAAGVLKHKQRKAKSARKLEAMDHHLDRVRDVTAEVARQLGPLERKAKRAQAYERASAELSELKLALAVDDLRRLQAEWGKVLEAEAAASAEVEAKRELVGSAEQNVNDIQEVLKRESEDAGTLAQRQRRTSSLCERAESATLLVGEHRRAALASRVDLASSLESGHARRIEAVNELESAVAQEADVIATSEAADAKVVAIADERTAIDSVRRDMEREIDEMSVSLSRCDEQIAADKRKLSSLQETLASGMAQVELVETRLGELKESLENSKADHAASSKALSEAEEALEGVRHRESEAQAKLIECFDEREGAHATRDSAREKVSLAETGIKAVEAALHAAREEEPALQWVIENASRYDSSPKIVSSEFQVSTDMEKLVEDLLGEDLAALAIEDASRAETLAQALSEGRLRGDVSMVVRDDRGAPRTVPARHCPYGRALVDDLTYSDEMAPIVESLLGDVVICPDRHAAFTAHEMSGMALRYVSLDGCAIWPSGKVRLYGKPKSDGEGVIARERKLRELRKTLSKAIAERDAAEKAAEAADDAYRKLQVDTLKLSQQLANSQGLFESARAEEQRAKERYESLEREIDQAMQRVDQANERVSGLRPDVAAIEKQIIELESQREAIAASRAKKLEEVEPLRKQAVDIGERLTSAKLEAATLAERKTYIQRMVLARKRDIEAIDADVVSQRRLITEKEVVVGRCDKALSVLRSIAEGLERKIRLLDEAVAASENTASGIHAKAAEARDQVRRAQVNLDAANENATKVQIEKSKLELRVEAAVNVIVRDLATPLDRAQELPDLEDRSKAEDDVFKLQRRIKNMGAINPAAAEEYAQLKERYDFLAGQLSDMEAARKSLNRITRVIDERMRDDFLNTFNQVNDNFSEVFSILFPGGAGHLSLEDPDDIENTGVEVTAQPRGKRLTKMMLMSGGEKSLTALALLFAVYKTRSTPFYILDEVEAALDDTNLRRLIAYIDTLRTSTQLIMITHQRRTMEMADVLFGVSMQADGVTKVISQKLERALEQAD